MPLSVALAAEGNPTINEETWKKALAAHPGLCPTFDAAKGKFLEESMRRLIDAEDLKHLCWLLERRYSEYFRKPDPPAAVVNVSTQISGLPDDVLERARIIAKVSSG